MGAEFTYAEISCPLCGEPHYDEGEWSTHLHHTHQCQNARCGHLWTLETYVIGVRPLHDVTMILVWLEHQELFGGWMHAGRMVLRTLAEMIRKGVPQLVVQQDDRYKKARAAEEKLKGIEERWCIEGDYTSQLHPVEERIHTLSTLLRLALHRRAQPTKLDLLVDTLIDDDSLLTDTNRRLRMLRRGEASEQHLTLKQFTAWCFETVTTNTSAEEDAFMIGQKLGYSFAPEPEQSAPESILHWPITTAELLAVMEQRSALFCKTQAGGDRCKLPVGHKEKCTVNLPLSLVEIEAIWNRKRNDQDA